MDMNKQKEELMDALSKYSDEHLFVSSERIFQFQRLKLIKHYLPDTYMFNMFNDDFKSVIKRIRKNDNTQARWDARKEKRKLQSLISDSVEEQPIKRRRM